MTKQPEIERLARALCDCRYPVDDYSVWDESLSEIDKAELRNDVRTILEALMENAPAETELWLWELLNEDKP